MIKARGKDLVLVGLTDVNLEKMQKGHPVSINLGEMLPEFPALKDMRLVIMHGKTESALQEELKDFIDPVKTKVIDLRNKPHET